MKHLSKLASVYFKLAYKKKWQEAMREKERESAQPQTTKKEPMIPTWEEQWQTYMSEPELKEEQPEQQPEAGFAPEQQIDYLDIATKILYNTKRQDAHGFEPIKFQINDKLGSVKIYASKCQCYANYPKEKLPHITDYETVTVQPIGSLAASYFNHDIWYISTIVTGLANVLKDGGIITSPFITSHQPEGKKTPQEMLKNAQAFTLHGWAIKITNNIYVELWAGGGYQSSPSRDGLPLEDYTEYEMNIKYKGLYVPAHRIMKSLEFLRPYFYGGNQEDYVNVPKETVLRTINALMQQESQIEAIMSNL
jgi:hypothetical protein